MARLTLENGVFFFDSPVFAERQKAREYGFRWDKAAGRCYTRELGVAVKLRDHATGSAESKIRKSLITVSPWTKPLPPSPPGLKRLWFQNKGIRFCLSQDRSYLGLPAGLGKTICAAIISKGRAGRPIVYVSPPFLVENVIEEFRKWAPELSTAVYPAMAKVVIVPDSILFRPDTLDLMQKLGKGRGFIIVDEAHRFKTLDAKRSKALFLGLLPSFPYQLYMSGTPMPNRPMELYPVLSYAAPETIDFKNQFDFGRRYCAGFRSRWGWDFTGASNIGELAAKVIAPSGRFMFRVKKEVLKLPPLTEEVFIVSEGMSPRLAKLDSAVKAAYGSADDIIRNAIAAKAGKEGGLHISTYQKLLGEHKVKFAVEYVASLLEETDESILLFAHHKEVLAALYAGLAKWKPYLITGATLSHERHEQVTDFQKNRNRRLFIASITTMVGFTLTKADRAVLCEYSWVPGINEQAIARGWRKGQTKNFLAQYLTYKDSIDKKVLEAVLEKSKAISQM